MNRQQLTYLVVVSLDIVEQTDESSSKKGIGVDRGKIGREGGLGGRSSDDVVGGRGGGNLARVGLLVST
jgi:hypothetical protein